MFRRCCFAALASLLTLLLLGPAAPAIAAGHATDLGEDVRPFGGASSFGSTASFDLNTPIVGMAPTPTGQGYWEVSSDGGIFAFGDAHFFGSTGAIRLNSPIVGMAVTRTGNGYWLVAADGGIFAFGDARFLGSTGSIRLNAPIVGMASTIGNGYWLVARDGGIFAFGDAAFYGSTGSIHLNQPVVGMAATDTSDGYWLVAADGGVFRFGGAAFYGSAAGQPLASPVVGMAATPGGGGYWLVAADGGIFTYGNATFFGSLGGTPLYQRAVGIAVTPTGNGYWIVLSGRCVFPGSTADQASSSSAVGPATSVLATVTVAPAACFDRVTFGFRTGGPNPIGFTVRYGKPPFSGPSGIAVPIRGSAFLVVRVSPAAMHDDNGASSFSGSTDIVAPTAAIQEVRFIEDFEGVVVWVIGLDRVRPFRAYAPDGTQLRVEISEL
jgi:hypothetical protein